MQLFGFIWWIAPKIHCITDSTLHCMYSFEAYWKCARKRGTFLLIFSIWRDLVRIRERKGEKSGGFPSFSLFLVRKKSPESFFRNIAKSRVNHFHAWKRERSRRKGLFSIHLIWWNGEKYRRECEYWRQQKYRSNPSSSSVFQYTHISHQGQKSLGIKFPFCLLYVHRWIWILYREIRLSAQSLKKGTLKWS